MSINGFTIIPNVMYDALERGIITPEMFDCLSLLHMWRGHNSNIVREVSAERLKKALSLLWPQRYEASKDDWPNVKTVRRWMRGLREAGWFAWDYEPGVERPYNTFLKNFEGVGKFFGQHTQECAKGCAQEQTENEKEGCAQTNASPSEIRHWKKTSAFQGCAEESTPLSNEGRGEDTLLGGDKGAKDKSPSVPVGTELRSASAVGDIAPRLPLFSPSVPAGETLAAGLESPQAKPAGKGNLLLALRRIAARELRNHRSVPKNRKPQFDLIELAHGFDAVVQDFTKWCGENLERHPSYPLTDYANVAQDRLGVPSLSDTYSPTVKPSDDPRVAELIRYVYDETQIAPDVKKVSQLLASYDADYVTGAMQHEFEGRTNDNMTNKEWARERARVVRTIFSESGGLAIVAAYRDMVLWNAVDLLARSSNGNKETAEKMCRENLHAVQVIGLYKMKEELDERARKKAKS